jgi:hypothetical protein
MARGMGIREVSRLVNARCGPRFFRSPSNQSSRFLQVALEPAFDRLVEMRPAHAFGK